MSPIQAITPGYSRYPLPYSLIKNYEAIKAKNQITKAGKERFKPEEFLWGDNLVTKAQAKHFRKTNNVNEIRRVHNDKDLVNDIQVSDNYDDLDIESADWSLDLEYADKVAFGRYIAKIQTEEDLAIEEATEYATFAVDNISRVNNWASDNEVLGKKAANYALASSVTGAVKSVLESFIFNPDNDTFYDLSPYSQNMIHLFNLIQGFTAGMRGRHQFKIYTGRPDDDGALNKYQADIYGNKVAGFFAEASDLFEKKINPAALVALGFFSPEIRDIVVPLLNLSNTLWWRVRLPGVINQELTTDAVRYIAHKPLSLLGVESSKEKINEIKKREILTWQYFRTRLYELADLPKTRQNIKNLIPHFFKLLKNVFFGNDTEKEEAVNKIDGFISPILGVIGSIACSVFVPMKSALNYIGIQSRTIDFLASIGGLTQNIAYIPRMTMKENIESKKLALIENKPEAIRLSKKRKKLFYEGLLANGLNIINSFAKLLPTDNQVSNFIRNITQELSTGSILHFFSKRRSVAGEQAKARSEKKI